LLFDLAVSICIPGPLRRAIGCRSILAPDTMCSFIGDRCGMAAH
jgi:hypothetical protein